MVKVTRRGAILRFEIEGFDKILALKGHLEIPLAHVTSARHDPDAAKGWWHGVRLPGTDLPGIVTAGSFYQKGRLVFYDVHHAEQAVVVELAHEDYDRLIVEVRDPAATVEMITSAIGNR